MFRKGCLLACLVAVLGLVGPALAAELVVDPCTTYTVTGAEDYSFIDIRGTLIVESGAVLTCGGSDEDPKYPRSRLNGDGAKIIVNGGTILADCRLDAGVSNDAYITMNGGLFRVGITGTDSDDNSFKFPDDMGGTHRLYLYDGVFWAYQCQAYPDRDAIIYVGEGEMLLTSTTLDDTYDPCEWLADGGLLPIEGYKIFIETEPNDRTRIYALPGYPYNPSPADGDANQCSGISLSWSEGLYADRYDIYFGTSLDYVGDTADPCVQDYDGNEWDPGALELGTTYYWRVDAVNDTCAPNLWKGDVWSFTTNDGNAYDEFPADGLRGLSPNVTFRWTPGCLAGNHNIYFGTSTDDVSPSADPCVSNHDTNSWTPPTLDTWTTYYWRVEEVNGASEWPGEAWTFRTGQGGLLMYYKFDGALGNNLPTENVDETGNVTFTKYIDPCEAEGAGSVKYGDPAFDMVEDATSADFTPGGCLYRPDPCDASGWDLLRLDGYQYTIEMWVKLQAIGDDDMTLMEKDGSWSIEIDEGDMNIDWSHAEAGEGSDGGSVREGEWIHVACVYDWADPCEDRMKVYIDGLVQGTDSNSHFNRTHDVNAVLIGANRTGEGPGPGNLDNHYDGLIDELRIWDIALEPDQFLLVPGPEWASNPSPYNGETDVDPCDPGLKLYWTPGIYADKHDIYFGTSAAYVGPDADPCVSGHDTNSWTPPTLELGTMYYWRIDANDSDPCDESPWTGVRWRFITKFLMEDPNLLVWYKLGETTGGTALDSSGYGHHADVFGPTSGWDPNDGYGGDEGGCREFDHDTYIETDMDEDDALEIVKAITVTVWVKGDVARGDDDRIIFDGADDAMDNRPYRLQAKVPSAGRNVVWQAGIEPNDVLTWTDSHPSDWDDYWVHYAFVKDENADVMQIWRNAEMVASRTGLKNTLFNLSVLRPFRLGGPNYDEDEDLLYDGKLDDFRIYKTALSERQIQEVMRGGDLTIAWNPRPVNHAADVAFDTLLSWLPGDYADTHDVYIGTDFDEVSEANSTIHPNVDYNNVADTNYDPGLLTLGQTYYWRVDEVNDSCQPDPWKGRMWEFTVADYIAIDDMEDYTEGSGSDYPIAASSGSYGWETSLSGHSDGSYLDVVTPTRYNWIPVGGGLQSMAYIYFNYGALYSEIANHFVLDPCDWTYAGVKMLTLWFRGEVTNDPHGRTQQMYVALGDSSDVYAEVRYGDNGEDMNDVKIEEWQVWNMPLSWFTDANAELSLTSMETLYIGFGDRTNTTDYGSDGAVYLDDIRLYPPTCVLSERSVEFAKLDLDDDCVISFGDVELMAEDWLKHDVNLGEVTAPSDTNLIAWWTFDEGSGGDAYDSSGNDHNGLIEFNDVDVYWVAGPNDVNYALDFDGGRVRVHDAQQLRPLHHITVCAWINYSTKQANGRIVVKGADNYETFGLEVGNDDELVFYVRDGNEYEDEGEDSYMSYALESEEDELERGDWLHVAGTYDGNSLRCYINGEVADANHDVNDSVILFLSQDTNDLAIGNRSDDDDRPFEGMIDDVRLYDYGLSEEEIAYIASNGGGIFRLDTASNVYNDELLGERAVNFKDFDMLADEWLKESLYP